MEKRDRFTQKSFDFLAKAGAQKNPLWLDQHQDEFEDCVVRPLKALAFHLARNLRSLPEARGFKFPRQGFGRLRRPSHKVRTGEPAYRNWVHLQSARPSAMRFDDSPRLYFFASPESVYAGGGLDEPSSRQVKSIRAWMADGPQDLIKLLRSKKFKNNFNQGFETDRVLKTFPRFYPQDHPRIEWLKLQAFTVRQNFSRREVYSSEFADLVLENWRQTLALNTLLFEGLAAWDSSLDPFVPQREDKADQDEDEESNSSDELWDERL